MAVVSELGAIRVVRKTGSEQIHSYGKGVGVNLREFWSWSSSDLVGNALRGMLAEYLVALDLGVSDGVRTEWDSYDLVSKEGITIEVKSAAYVQTWAQRTLSRIAFDVSPSRAFDPRTNAYTSEKKRQADIYVFSLLKHREKDTIDPLDVSQWSFYLLPTAILDEKLHHQKTIGLNALLELKPSVVPFGHIHEAVKTLCP